MLLYRRIRYGYAFRKIPLTKGKFAIVDPEDYERLSKYKWRVCIKRHTYYVQRAIKTRGKWTSVMMHRDIIKVGPGMVVDHINHNGADNRKANLRAAMIEQNAWNRRRKKDSFTGVSWNKKNKKWRAAVSHNGISEYISYFESEIEAAKAYDRAALKHRGEFAVLNFQA